MTNHDSFLTRLFLVLALTLALVGCQSASEEDWAAFCNNDQWASHGYFDATNGFSIQMLSVYKDRCGADLAREDENLYQRGFLKGIKEFCTFETGYKLGRDNKADPESCPPELAKDFNAGFQNGRADYVKEEVVKRMLEDETRKRNTLLEADQIRRQSGEGREQ